LIGNGTNSSPFIVHDWSEFGTVNTSTNKGKYIRFTDIHVENGDWAISGSGRSAGDPCIVSTYREMLHATGAANIHLCKCINKDLPNGERLYRYDEEGPETHEVTSTYCRYNPSPSTIDYNNISDSYRGSIIIYTHVDFNGWTMRNFKVQFSGMSYTTSCIFTCGENSYAGAELYNAFIVNMQVKITNNTRSGLFNVNIHDCAMHIEVENSLQTNTKLAFGNNANNGFSKNSLVLKVTGGLHIEGFASGTTTSFNIVDSLIELDLDLMCYGVVESSINLTRTTIKGKFKYTSKINQGYTLLGSCVDSINDVEYVSSVTPYSPWANGTRCIFNKDKVSWSRSGWTGVTSEELLDPATLQSKGFSIGVDNNA